MVFKHPAKHDVTLADGQNAVILLIKGLLLSQIEQDLIIVVIVIVIRLVLALRMQRRMVVVFRNHQRQF